jgi:chromosome segregation ATPase
MHATPPTPQEISGVMALLAVVADPAGAKARLDDLRAMSERIAADYSKAQKERAEAEQLRAAAARDKAEGEALARQARIESDSAAQLAQRLNERGARVAEGEARLQAEKATFTAESSAKNSELQKREEALKAAEAAAEKAMQEAVALRNTAEQRLSALQKAMA